MRNNTGRRVLTLIVVTAMVTSTFATAAVAAGVTATDGTAAAVGGGASTAADIPGSVPASSDQYAVRQAGNCQVIEPLGDGSQSVEEFYDYQINASGGDVLYSSVGTKDLQENQVSQFFVYEGTNGTSLVMLHDAVNGTNGGTVEMTFTGLPENGTWAVEDDDYPNRDDEFVTNGTTSNAVWMWTSDRNDGGAFSALNSSFERITIDPAFNEESSAYPYGEWFGTNESNHLEQWMYRTGTGGNVTLDMSQNVTIEPGTCDDEAPSASVTASTTDATTNEEVTFDASESSDDGDIIEYQWDFDGDGTVETTTEDPTVAHQYSEGGEFDATVTVIDEGRNDDAASVSVAVENVATDVEGCRVIDESGTYNLTADIQNETGPCIEITADNVTLNGNNHSIVKDGSRESNGVLVTGGASNVVVRNLVVRGWTVGVEAGDASGVRMTDIYAEGNLYGTFAEGANNVTITDSVAVDSFTIGFAHTRATNVTHRNNTAYGSQWGFHFEQASTDATLTNVTAYNNSRKDYYHYPNGYTGPMNTEVNNMTADGVPFGFSGGSGATFTGANVPFTPENATTTGEYLSYQPVLGNPTLDRLSMSYTDEVVESAGFDESSLTLWRYTRSAGSAYDSGEWVQVESTVDTDANEVTTTEFDPQGGTWYTFAIAGNATGETPTPDEAPTAVIDAPANATVDEPVSFSGANSSDDGTIESYEWSFGDGANATGESVEHTYEEAGEYEVTLTVTDDAGNTDTASTTLTVDEANEAPVAVIDAPANATVGETVGFSGANSSDNGTIESYEWSFGDGANATGESVEHVYNESGEYEVTLTVTDDVGATNSTSQTVTVDPVSTPPNATFTVESSVPAGQNVTLDASGSSDENGISGYRWDFDGDGSIDETTQEPTVEHAFTTLGDVTVSLTVVDGTGATATANRTVTVADDTAPTAAVTPPTNATTNTSLVFSAVDSSDNLGVVDYEWTFGDDTSATGPVVLHNYSEPGTYSVGLTVTDAADNTATTTVEVVVEAGAANATPPTASLDATDTVSVGNNVTLDASGSSDDDNGISEYRWDFDGDGEVDETTTEATVEHSYDGAGNVTAVVTVVDTNGSTAAALETIEVVGNDAPVAVIDGPTEATAGESVGFSGGNSSDDGTIESYEWSFGDDTTATGESVDHTYDESGNYTVQLSVTDDADNTDTASLNVTVTAASGGGNGDGGGGGGGGGPIGGGDDDDEEEEETPTPTATPTPQPADISVTALEANRTNVAPGQSIELTATVENAGDEAGNYTVELELFDEVVAQRTVEVTGGETVTVSFVQSIDAAGTYTARAGGQTVSLTVGQAAGGQTATAEVTTTTTPGFGPVAVVLAALVALAGCALAVRREDGRN